MIDVGSLRKVFKDRKRGEVIAVSDVTFRCEAGRIFGLLGPNGAGKTTILRILATMLKPTSGTAVVGGCDVVGDPQGVRRQIGFLSGTTGVYGRLTAREMVAYFGRLYGLSEEEIRRRTDETFRLFGVEEFADRRCDKLSTGMKQKVSIARTIIHDPPIVFFDEPTTGLDVITSRTIVDFIRNCKVQGKCVVFSTHILSEAEKLCDTVAIIHQGRLFAEGTVAELKATGGADNLEDAFLRIVGVGT